VFSQRSSVIEGPIAIVAQHQTVSTNDAAVRPWPDGTGGYGIALRPVPPGELKASYPY